MGADLVAYILRRRTTRTPVIEDGLICHLDAGNTASYPGTGTTWFDLSGNNRNFTLSNVSYNSANNGILTFNGTNALASVSHTNSPFRRTDAITYEFFVRQTANAQQNLGGVNVSGGQGTGGLQMSNTQIFFFWTPSNPLSDRFISASFSANKLNTWMHIVWTINYSSQTYAFYENGNSLTTSVSGSWTTMSPATQYQRNDVDAIGGRFVNSFSYWTGQIGIFRLYNRSLSASEVQNNYNSQRGRYQI